MDVISEIKKARKRLAEMAGEKKKRRKERRRSSKPKNNSTILERIRNFKLSTVMCLGMCMVPTAMRADTPEKNKDNLEGKELSIDPDLIAGIIRWKPVMPKVDIKSFSRQIVTDYPEVVDEIISREANTRADKLLQVYVSEMNAQVDTLKMSRRGTLAHNRQRTKVVNQASGASYKNARGVAYCLATVQAAFVKLSRQYPEFTDLTHLNGEHNGLSCAAFVDYVKRNFPDCVVYTKSIKRTMMEKDTDGNYKYGAGTLAWQKQKGLSHMISFDGRDENGAPLYDAGNRDVDDAELAAGIAGYVIDTKGILKELAKYYVRDDVNGIVLDYMKNKRDNLYEIVDGLKQKNPEKFATLAQKMLSLSSKGLLSENSVEAPVKNAPLMAAYMSKRGRPSAT